MATIKTKTAAYLASHLHLRLGTVTVHCTPQIHTVGHVSGGCTAYFVTDRKNRKAEYIYRSPTVAYAVDANYEDVMTIRKLQLEGRASLLAMETDAMRIPDLMRQKFPGMGQMPANPDLVIFKAEPTKGYCLDNTLAAGHRNMVDFS